MNSESNHAVRAEINVTPLVDVVLVLLIIFMVVTPILVTQGVRLPTTAHPGKVAEEDRSKTISLTAAGLLYFEREPVSEDGLQQQLKDLYDRNPDAQILLRADRSVSYGDVHRVLDSAAGAGFHNLGLLANPDPSLSAVSKQ